MRTAMNIERSERKKREEVFRTTLGCRPSTMPQANAPAIAKAGSLMALFAILPVFQCGKSAGRDRTDAFPRFHTECLVRRFPSVSWVSLSTPPNPEPAWKDRRKGTQFLSRRALLDFPLSLLLLLPSAG